MNNHPPSRAAGNFSVQLGVELKAEWSTWCAKHGLVPGKALRSLVERTIQEGIEPPEASRMPATKVAVAKAPDQGPKVRRELHLTPTEDTAIEAVSKAQGFGYQDWVVAAVRAALVKAPSYGQAELEVLSQSNLRLAQIVGELSALRRAENREYLAEGWGRLEMEVRDHVAAASLTMAQGAQRWLLKV
jgi:hypothetical protein